MKRMPALTKKLIRPKTLGKSSSETWPRSRTASSTAIALRERVGDLLDRRRAGLLQVVAADVDRVPARDLVHREGDHVGDQPHRGPRREGVGAAREVLLDDVVLGRAAERGAVDALLVGDGDVEAEQPGGGRVDRHRGVHLARAGCRRAASPCRRGGRPRRRPCRPRPGRARRRGRSRSGSAGRRRSRARSGPWRGSSGRARSTGGRRSGPRRCASPTGDPAARGGVRSLLDCIPLGLIDLRCEMLAPNGAS